MCDYLTNATMGNSCNLLICRTAPCIVIQLNTSRSADRTNNNDTHNKLLLVPRHVMLATLNLVDSNQYMQSDMNFPCYNYKKNVVFCLLNTDTSEWIFITIRHYCKVTEGFSKSVVDVVIATTPQVTSLVHGHTASAC